MAASELQVLQPIPVPFHGDTIVCGQPTPADRPLVAFRPTCEAMGLPYESQYKRLRRHPWATVVMMTMVAADGKPREMAFVDRKTFVMWLAGIEAGRLANRAIAEKIVLYQREAADVLDRHFFGVSPSSGVPAVDLRVQTARLILDITERQVEMERRQLAIEADASEAKAKAEKAIVMAEAAMCSVVGDTKFVALPGYCSMHRIKLGQRELSIIGQRLSRQAKAMGIPLKKVHSEAWGHINAYPVEFLDRWRETSAIPA